jgi:hypothetical protein
MAAGTKWWQLCAALAVVLCVATSVASADTWVAVDSAGSISTQDSAPGAPPKLMVAASSARGLTVNARLEGVLLQPVKNKDGQPFVQVTWPDAAAYGEVGTPALPVIRRLFVAPEGAQVSYSVRTGPQTIIDGSVIGMDLVVWPVQEPVEKVPGAFERATFRLDEVAYSNSADLLAERATVQYLGVVRGQPLWQLEIYPVAYNPAKRVLSFCGDITVDVTFAGGTPRASGRVLPGLHRVVLNPELLPAPAGRPQGNYLIVVASAHASGISSFAQAKTAQGYTVSTYTVAPGTTKEQIKAYIQGLWGGPNEPDYILLVGDVDTIPNWTGGGAGSPPTDLPYCCMDGSADWYPDIPLGRFPAATAAHLTAMVDKTLYYEGGAWADPQYVKRAVFMASEDNYTVSEGTHNYCIANYMVPNDIAADKLYCHTYQATTQQVRDSFNGGRFYGVYSGHGSETYWADGPVFYQSDVNGLTNANMYAYVCSFSCLTGNYTVSECFMETWVRAPNKGAVVAMGSSVTSYWTEDDVLQRRLFDTIYDENQPNIPKQIGPILIETKMRYLAQMGSGSTTRRYFEMYNIMGDPSLGYPGNCSDAGTIVLDKGRYACESSATIRVLDCGPNVNPDQIDTVTVTITSNSEPTGESVLLTETNPNSALFEGTIALSPTNAVGVLQVSPGDTVVATYQDADNGQGQPATVTATAVVDCTPPTLTNVEAINIEPRAATIRFQASEPARGIVHYGLSCDALNLVANGSGFSVTPTVPLSGLQDNTTYFYRVEAVDEAGNVGSDPNCYWFTTPEVPDYFTQLFTADNDLDNLSLIFTPNASVDFYAGCVEENLTGQFPTNPAGGTPLSLTDDSYATVTLTGGARVWLYGVSYSTFYVGSNGYITFASGNTTYSESYANHFNQPRISALFDDLNPSAGGSVSWKQLSDRAVVTWQNVPEYGTSNQNSFQIEMFFDGQIRIHYLALAATDGLAGLSRGQGVPADFLPSDLSNLGSCGPRPPYASGSNVQTPVNTPVVVTLTAADDGLPDPPGALTYIVVTLPAHGRLYDPQGGQITAVPYALLYDMNQVEYRPQYAYQGADSFQFRANDGGTPPEGGDSNIATVSIVVGGPRVLYSFPLDQDPGWSVQGQWAFGRPTGGGSSNRDPTSGHTGLNVYGYNLNGDYTNNMPVYYLTTTPLDLTGVTQTELRFWRWLGVESASYDHANVQISNNGSTWYTIWEHTGGSVSDSAWSQRIHDISQWADNQATVWIRWGMGPTDSSVTYPGWNIDDIEIWGVVPYVPTLCPGDMNCDGQVTYADIDGFVEALAGESSWSHDCPWLNADTTGDGDVTYADIDPFVALIGTTCP